MKCLATVLAIFGLTILPSLSAHAGYVDGYGMAQVTHSSNRHGAIAVRHGAVATVRAERGNLVAANGRTASVSGTALPHFRCLIAWLDAAGYEIQFMNGFASRPGNPSAHPTGNALDINQTGRGRVTRAFPAGVDGAARRCGLTPGSEFGDTGHFEMAGKVGYVFPASWHPWRYAKR